MYLYSPFPYFILHLLRWFVVFVISYKFSCWRFRSPENAKVEQLKAAMEDAVFIVIVPKVEVKKPEVKNIQICGYFRLFIKFIILWIKSLFKGRSTSWSNILLGCFIVGWFVALLVYGFY